MNIAVCDDQLEELKAVESLLRAWQEQQCAAIRLHLFHNAGELLEVARKERFTLYLLDDARNERHGGCARNPHV